MARYVPSAAAAEVPPHRRARTGVGPGQAIARPGCHSATGGRDSGPGFVGDRPARGLGAGVSSARGEPGRAWPPQLRPEREVLLRRPPSLSSAAHSASSRRPPGEGGGRSLAHCDSCRVLATGAAQAPQRLECWGLPSPPSSRSVRDRGAAPPRYRGNPVTEIHVGLYCCRSCPGVGRLPPRLYLSSELAGSCGSWRRGLRVHLLFGGSSRRPPLGCAGGQPRSTQNPADFQQHGGEGFSSLREL